MSGDGEVIVVRGVDGRGGGASGGEVGSGGLLLLELLGGDGMGRGVVVRSGSTSASVFYETS